MLWEEINTREGPSEKAGYDGNIARNLVMVMTGVRHPMSGKGCYRIVTDMKS